MDTLHSFTFRIIQPLFLISSISVVLDVFLRPVLCTVEIEYTNASVFKDISAVKIVPKPHCIVKVEVYLNVRMELVGHQWGRIC